VALKVATLVLLGAHAIVLQPGPVRVPVTAVGYLKIIIPDPPDPPEPTPGPGTGPTPASLPPAPPPPPVLVVPDSPLTPEWPGAFAVLGYHGLGGPPLQAEAHPPPPYPPIPALIGGKLSYAP